MPTINPLIGKTITLAIRQAIIMAKKELKRINPK